jgi:hypothetical protein
MVETTFFFCTLTTLVVKVQQGCQGAEKEAGAEAPDGLVVGTRVEESATGKPINQTN